MRNTLGSFRRSLTRYESTLAYALLGVVGGLVSGKRSLRGIVTRERIERYSLSFIYSES